MPGAGRYPVSPRRPSPGKYMLVDIVSASSTPTMHRPRLPEKGKNSPFALHMKISISGGGRSGSLNLVDMDDQEARNRILE